MNITFSEDFIRLVGLERIWSLKDGTASLFIGVDEILYYYDNMAHIDVIKNGTIKNVV